jgi:lysophospholipase L1-like esterase
MIRLVALGDSTTAGFGDPMPDGRWRGWAEILAGALGPDVTFTNLARSGARTADVAAEQLARAVAARPTVAVLLVGVNDTLRRTFDVARVGADLDRTVHGLTATGAHVLTTCLPDPARMFGLPTVIGRPLARRIGAVNAVVHRVADRYAAVHMHTSQLPGAYDPRMWSVDRLHPGERGHRLLAVGAYDALAARGLPVGRRPGLEPTNPPPTGGDRLWWMATRGTRWLVDRSTDLLPYLARVAAAEWWYGVRGAAHRLDEAMQREVAAALPEVYSNEAIRAAAASATGSPVRS